VEKEDAMAGEARAAEAPKEPREPVPPRTLRSAALLGAGREIVILHGGEAYRLRVTRNGKLILTK
jgi:hemin uptake protein HemP